MVHLFLILIIIKISLVQTLDYDRTNKQTCTHKPFMANFRHNCSRTRLNSDVSIPNSDQVLHITIILASPSNANTSFRIIKSSVYNQTVTFTFLTDDGRHMYINNNSKKIDLNDSTISSYLYSSLYGYFAPVNDKYLVTKKDHSVNSYCALKHEQILPNDTSRIYYLYTNETNLIVDLSASTYHISPVFTGFNGCFGIEKSLTTTAIVLIVVVSVLSFVTTILIVICLRKQLKQLYTIWINYMRDKLGRTPTVTVRPKPSG